MNKFEVEVTLTGAEDEAEARKTIESFIRIKNQHDCKINDICLTFKLKETDTHLSDK